MVRARSSSGRLRKTRPGCGQHTKELKSLYDATAEQRDAFSLDGYLDVIGPDNVTELPERLPKDSDYREVLKVFPEPRLAKKIFGTMENARLDGRLRHAYRGLRKDLDLMKQFLRQSRPYIFDVPAHLVPFELLFQITLCGGATDDARQFYGQVVSEIEGVVESYLTDEGVWKDEGGRMKDEKESVGSDPSSFILHPSSFNKSSLPSVADALMATSRVYNLFQNISPDQTQEAESDSDEEKGEYAYEDKESAEAVTEEQLKREERPKEQPDIRDLFNAWNSMDDEGEPDDIQGSEAWSQHEMPEQMLEPDDVAFAYDEWDRELNDYRVGWSRVHREKGEEG
jgi:hypothetical protein